MKKKIILLTTFLLLLGILRIISLPIGDHKTIHQPKQDGYYDYQGVIHFHTQYSGDATGSFEEIAAIANQQDINFMISTDHNTLKPLEDKKEGWYGNTLILVGEELTRPEGYLLAMNLKNSSNFSGHNTEKIISDIMQQGGLVVIAHTGHPKWKWKGEVGESITGEEIMDFADAWYSAPPGTLLLSLIYYPFNPTAAFMELYKRPVEVLREWDRRNQEHRFIGITAPDFHQSVRIGRDYKIRFPKADKVMPIAHNHVIMRTPFSGNISHDRKILFEALQNGHVYISMDLLGNASGFFFSAKQGNETAWIGDQLSAGRETTFTINLPAAVPFKHFLTHIYRNGVEIAQSAEPKFNIQDNIAGAYRVEVEVEISTFLGRSRNVVWIYSNPVYLR